MPPARAAGRDLNYAVIDIDATLVSAHSEKEGTAGNFKGGFGYHPILAFLDNTGEALAALLRPGNAGSVRHEVAHCEWMHRLEVG